jgi:cytoskeletal protein RodZ
MESATEKEPELIRPNSPEPDELVQAARESAHSGPVSEPEPVSIAAVTSKETAPVSETSASEEEAEISPALTESEAIALAVETTSAQAATPEASQENQEGSVPELQRPLPPDPELVEAAISDALEKSQDFSPPESADT